MRERKERKFKNINKVITNSKGWSGANMPYCHVIYDFKADEIGWRVNSHDFLECEEILSGCIYVGCFKCTPYERGKARISRRKIKEWIEKELLFHSIPIEMEVIK